MKTIKLFLLAAFASLAAVTVTAQGVSDPEGASEEGSILFDGASPYARAVSPQATAKDKEDLLAEFKKHVIMDDHGVPAERTAMEAMLAKMMESPTAREVAAKFIKADAKVKFSLEEMPGSAVETKEGKKTIVGFRGHTLITDDPPGVVLNKLYMQPGVEGAEGTLAHEMLGHALERQLYGGGDDVVYQYNETEEENARLIGWLVATELKGRPEYETWSYLENPEENNASLKLMSANYSLGLTSDEMKDPVSVYKQRLLDADAALVTIGKGRKNMKGWTAIIEHFIGSKHKMEAASFQTLKEDIGNKEQYFPMAEENLRKIKEALNERLTFFATPEGKKFLAKLAEESEGEYFQKKDEAIMERRARLEGLLRGKTPESFKTPPAIGQVTWPELQKFWRDEKKSCASGVLP